MNFFYKNFILKSELISYGVNVKLPINGISYTPILRSLYDYDQEKTDDINLCPQDIILKNENNQNFYARVRRNPKSPWTLFEENKKAYLKRPGYDTFEVYFPFLPNFYNDTFFNNNAEEKITSYVQNLGEDILTITINNYCEFYSRNYQCSFCEIKKTHEDVKLNISSQKDLEQVAKAIGHAVIKDDRIKILAFNGGNFSKNKNVSIKKFIEVLEKTKKYLPLEKWETLEKWIVAMPPEDFHLLEELKKAGATLVLFNLEFWKEASFNVFCRGKATYGRDKIILALEESVKIFGKGNVLTCLIYGLQSISLRPPYRFNGKIENEILLECLDVLAEKKIILLNNIYHQTGRNALGPINYDAESLREFHLEYGKRITKKNIIADNKEKLSVIFGNLGSIPNSLNNESAFIAFKEQEICCTS
jgi:hypothetical protein